MKIYLLSQKFKIKLWIEGEIVGSWMPQKMKNLFNIKQL